MCRSDPSGRRAGKRAVAQMLLCQLASRLDVQWPPEGHSIGARRRRRRQERPPPLPFEWPALRHSRCGRGNARFGPTTGVCWLSMVAASAPAAGHCKLSELPGQARPGLFAAAAVAVRKPGGQHSGGAAVAHWPPRRPARRRHTK